MKKIILIAIALFALLVFCCEISEEIIIPDPEDQTKIIINNSNGICDVSVYSFIPRSDDFFITRVPAGKISDAIKYSSGNDKPFFFTYHLNFKGITGFSLDFISGNDTNQAYINVIENTTTNITIPGLSETLLSKEELLLKNSYVLIYNDSSFPVQFTRGSAILPPDNAVNPSATSVNTGERAVYTIEHTNYPILVSDYTLYRNTIEVPFSGNLVNFEKGFIYSFTCDGNKLFLVNELEIKYENVEDVSHNTTVPKTPQAPVAIAQDRTLTVKWTAVEGAVNYEVYLGTEFTPPLSPVNTVPGTTVVLTGLTNKTIYYIWIKAVNNAGASGYSDSCRAIPWAANENPAVHEISQVIPGINRVTITWEESGGASSYEVYTSTTTTNRPSVPVLTTDKINASIDGLENNTIYYFWIRAKNNAGYSAFSNIVSGTPQIPVSAPDIPSRPVLTPGNKEITVSWQEVAHTESYEIWLGATNNSLQAKKYGDDISGTQIIVKNLNNNTTYYIWLKAKNIAGTSGFSPPASASPSVFVVPPQMPVINSVSAGDKELTVNWMETEGALSYEIWKGITNNLNEAEKYGVDITNTSVIITNLVNETNYYIWVRAKNNSGTGNFCSAIIGKPLFSNSPFEISKAPSVIASNGQLELSWQAAENASVYEIWIGEIENVQTAVKQVDDVSGLSAIAEGLKNGCVYYIWIRAKNNAGTSGFSPAASGTPIGNIGEISLISENNKLSVSWNEVAGAQSYEVYFAYADAIPASPIQIITVTSVAFNVNAGSNCFIWVKPVNTSGSGGLGKTVWISGEYGLYKKTNNVISKINNYNLTEALNYISGNSINGDKFVIILDNESISGQTLSYSGKEIEISLMGYQEEKTITLNSNGNLFRIGNKVTLILDQYITLKGKIDNNASLIYIEQSGYLVMNDRSKITDNSNTVTGGGVSVAAGASFIMNGGVISGNSASQGAGVMTRGNFTMRGGSINNNTAQTGGGVGAAAGESFTMYDGTISGNKAANGAGIYSWGTFTMHGGSISNNKAETDEYSIGGGIVVSSGDGKFIMNRGTINGNYADLGGGVQVWGSFTMNGGTIKENSSKQSGGIGIFNGGIFTMNGGEINGNISELGGGVSCAGEFVLNNGIIRMNTSQFGGGVYIGGDGLFTMYNGVICGNKALSDAGNSMGGGVVAEGIFYMHGGSIYGNIVTASDAVGGGVAIFNSGVFKKFSFNQSSLYSGIIYGEDETGKDEDGLQLKNSAAAGSAVWSIIKSRNNTADRSDEIDSTTGVGLN